MSVVRLPGRYEATFICFDSALSFAYLFAFLRCFLAYGNCLLTCGLLDSWGKQIVFPFAFLFLSRLFCHGCNKDWWYVALYPVPYAVSLYMLIWASVSEWMGRAFLYNGVSRPNPPHPVFLRARCFYSGGGSLGVMQFITIHFQFSSLNVPDLYNFMIKYSPVSVQYMCFSVLGSPVLGLVKWNVLYPSSPFPRMSLYNT